MDVLNARRTTALVSGTVRAWISAACAACLIAVPAHGVSLQWSETLNGSWSGSMIPSAVTQSDGGVFVAGAFDNGLGNSLVAMRMDAATGATQWLSSQTNRTSSDFASAALGPDSSFVVAFASTVVKYDRDSGAVRWSATMSDAVARIAVDGNGHVLVAAVTNEPTLSTVTMKLDGSTGAVLWSVSDNVLSCCVMGLALDGSGDALVLGFPYNGSGNDMRVVKYSNASGAKQWESQYAGPMPFSYDYPIDVRVDPVGNVVLFASESVPVPPFYSANLGALRTIKLDGRSGALLWAVAETAEVTGPSDGHGLRLDASGNVTITGALSVAGGFAQRTTKYDGADGHVLWARTLPLLSRFATSALALDEAGNVALVAQANPAPIVVVYDGESGSTLWQEELAIASGPTWPTPYHVVFDAIRQPVVAVANRVDVARYELATMKFSATGDLLWTAHNPPATGARFLAYPPDSQHAMAIDRNGDVWVTGGSFDDIGPNARLTKLNGATGNAFWSAGIPGIDRPLGRHIVVDGAGDGVVIAHNLSQSGRSQVAKFAGATGAGQWQVDFGTAAGGTSLSNAVAVDARGDVFVTGHEATDTDEQVLRTMKFAASDGSVRWSAGYAEDKGPRLDEGFAVALDATGDAYVAGYSTDLPGHRTLRVLKYDNATGVQRWAAGFAGDYPGPLPAFNGGLAIRIDGLGHPIVTGYSTDIAGFRNARTLKLDPVTGNVIWTARIVGQYTSSESGFAIAVDAANDAYVAITGGAGVDIVKYDGVSGATVWAKTFDTAGTGALGVTTLTLDDSGNLVVGGTISDPIAGSRIAAIKLDGLTGGELWRYADAGTARRDASMGSIAAGPAATIGLLGVAFDDGRPSGWLIQKLNEELFTIGGTVGPNGTIDPSLPRSVAQGARPRFSVRPAPGYYAIAGGTCDGALTGTTYMSASITRDCTLDLQFQLATLDIDGSDAGTRFDALTDGVLVMRYLFGVTGPALVAGATGETATRTTPDAVGRYLDAIRPALDVDGDGAADALTDGIMILRYLFGVRGTALTARATSPGATRTLPEIEAYLALITGQ